MLLKIIKIKIKSGANRCHTDCSDRYVLSTVATLKLNVGAWIQESFGNLEMFCSNPIFKLQMYTIAQNWRVLPPPAAFLISGKTFQF